MHKTSPAEIPGGLDDFYADGSTLEEDTTTSTLSSSATGDNNGDLYKISKHGCYTYSEVER